MTYSPSTGLRGLRSKVTKAEETETRDALFLRAHGFISGCILALESADEPFKDTSGAVFGCGALCYICEELWAFAPVCCKDRGMSDDDEVIDLGAPGNSVNETGERMNGGAVREERSPETEAMLRSS